MNLTRILNSTQLSPHSNTVKELLLLNEKIKDNGLALTVNDATALLTFRNKVLQDHARVELGIGVLKELIVVFSFSPYINQELFADTLNELQEIFYYIRNETEDKIGDSKLIQLMEDFYNGPCSGSMELLRSHCEEFAERFRQGIVMKGRDMTWE